MATVELDADFLALPLEGLRSAALDRARALGCENAEVRIERIRSQVVRLRDGHLETSADDLELGMGIRVVHDGSFGFAATVELDSAAAAALAEEAVATARATAPAFSERVELAEEPPHGEAVWTSSYEIDPAEVPTAEKVALLEDWSGRLLQSAGCRPRDRLRARRRRGQALRRSRRHRHHPAPCPRPPGGGGDRGRRRGRRLRVDAHSGAAGRPRLGVPPRRRAGTGTRSSPASPTTSPRSSHAPSVEPGAYDLVIDPTNLWLTIHESIGHATELDRAMGYEAAYAGTSFATFDKLGTLRYGSQIMNVTGDRTSSTGWRRSATTTRESRRRPSTSSATACSSATSSTGESRAETGLGRSNGCAFADSPLHTYRSSGWRTSRCVRHRGDGPTTDELISGGRPRLLRRSATRAGRSTCSATTSSSPGSASSGSRKASSPGR